MSSRGGGGGRGGAGAIRTSRPGIKAGTGGSLPAGGGSAPTLPSNATAGTVASQWITWGSYGHGLTATSTYATWKSWGFTGHLGGLSGSGYFSGFGGSYTMIGSTAVSLNGAYDWQRVYEGYKTNGINSGGASDGTQLDLGVFRAKVGDSSIIAGLVVRVADSTFPSAGAIGDLSNSTTRSNFCTQAKLWAQGINFLGGNALGLDLEYGNWGTSTDTNYETLGYEFATAFWSTSGVATLDLFIYDWQAAGSWHVNAASGGSVDPTDATQLGTSYLNRTQFVYGLMRGHTAASATGRIVFIDAFFYRGTQFGGATLATAMKWNSQGRRNIISRGVAQATWNRVCDYFYVEPFSWAGTDGTGYYDGSQQGQPAYTNDLETYRQWGEAGAPRAEFTLGASGTPGADSTHGGSGTWAGGNDYLTPSGRTTAMASSVSTTPVSTSVPTFSNVSASGGTVSCRVSHAWGTKFVKVYSGANFNPANPAANYLGAMPMTWTLNGGSETGGLSADYQACSYSTSMSAGDWFVIGAKTIKDDVAWTRVQAA